MKKAQLITLLALLILTLGVSAYAQVVSETPVTEISLPCSEGYDGCTAGGGSHAFCYGRWCGCMYSTYGYVCPPALN